MLNLIKFRDAIASTKGTMRNLLIGDGFSEEHFSYKKLVNELNIDSRSVIKELFDDMHTDNFALVIRVIELLAAAESAFGNHLRAEELRSDAQWVRQALVDAIRKAHLGHRENNLNYSLPAKFLKNFNTVFSLNHDLPLYWADFQKVNLQSNIKPKDGFGLGYAGGGFIGPFKEHACCNVYNLHGGLHLFKRPNGDIEKCVDTGEGVMANIADAILNKKRMPICVEERAWRAKKEKIRSIAYLRHCYYKLRSMKGVLFVYGHSADDADSHIYRAIFKSDINHVYFGVHQPTCESVQALDEKLYRYRDEYWKPNGSHIEYKFFDAESANVWRKKKK